MPPRIYICFTCLRDSALLPLHFAALRRAAPGSRVFYVFHPDEKPQARVPGGATRVFAEFPRNGNLLGLPCHLGMLRTMRYLSELNHNACVIKIDSDVFMLSDTFLAELGRSHDMIGVAPAREYYCKGTCYGITHELIGKVIHYLEHGYRDLSGRLEDSVISMVAAIVSDAHKIHILNASEADSPDILYSIFHQGFLRNPAQLNSIRGFLDCGDTTYTADFPDPVSAKISAMQFLCRHFSAL